MGIFNKSTRSIVTGKRAGAAGISPATDSEGNPVATAEGGVELQAASLEQQRKGNVLLDPRSWPKTMVVFVIGVIAVVLVGIVVIFNLNADRPGETVATDPTVGFDQAIVAVQADAALTQQVAAGDIVRLYGEDGQLVPELQYVEVYQSAAGNGLLLLVDDEQASALVAQDTIQKVVLIVHNDADRAAELLDLQKRINNPVITLKMMENAIISPGGTLEMDLQTDIQPVEAELPAIKWSSSDTAVAIVQNGKVSPIAVGETVITASCGGVEAHCNVTVIDIKLSQEEAVLGVGETLQLTADAGDFAVTWSAADPEVATVMEDGTVSGVAPGSTTVTASYGEVSMSCTVTVGYRAEVVQLSEQNITMKFGENLQLTATTYPGENVIDTGVWESSDTSIVTVSGDGIVVAGLEGIATVTYRCGAAQASCTITVEKK